MTPTTEIRGKRSILLNGANRRHIGFFDGLRGGLSLWVFIYHAAVMTGFNTGLIPPGALAVDLFMMISGFVMVYTLSARPIDRSKLPLDNIISFYLRRIIRIVPVYYFVLFIAIAFYGSFLAFSREATAAFPPLWAADLGNDPSINTITPENIILHMTFLFGLNPHYASDMPIPDWSLTLEMQFYAVVPFLLMAMKKYGLTLPIAGLAILSFLTSRYIGLYLTPKIGGLWPQPSMLLFKIDYFIAGMLLALYFVDEQFNKVEIFCWLLILTCLEANFIFAAAAALCFSLLVRPARKKDVFAHLSEFFRSVLQSKPMAFFGNISYDLYLLHPLILLTTIHFLLKDQLFVVFPAPIRFVILISISAVFVVPISYLIHIIIERPCQKAARPICAWVLAKKRPSAARPSKA